MEEELQRELKKLEDLKQVHYEIGLAMYQAAGAKIFGSDLLAMAVLNRSVALIDGFCTLVRGGNYLCAASIVRLQLDSALRFSALWHVDDTGQLAQDVLAGKHIRNLKARDGSRLTDAYLVEQLSKDYPWAKRVYKATSGFIHLSDKHVFHSVRNLSDDGTFTMAVATGDEHVPLDAKLEGAAGLLAITEVLFDFVRGWTASKHEGKAKNDDA